MGQVENNENIEVENKENIEQVQQNGVKKQFKDMKQSEDIKVMQFEEIKPMKISKFVEYVNSIKVVDEEINISNETLDMAIFNLQEITKVLQEKKPNHKELKEQVNKGKGETKEKQIDQNGNKSQKENQTSVVNMMAEFNKIDEQGLDYTARTSCAVAYDRAIESAREDRLFCDPIAKHFGQYGGKDVSALWGLFFNHAFKDFIIVLNACRTQLINNQLEKWINSVEGNKQVLNLGAGMDTRVFWVDCLKNVNEYIEVDVETVNNLKSKVLSELDVQPLCGRKSITMDFNKESVKDLPKHGVDQSIPTCWILEGLIMYLEPTVVEKMLEEINELSSKNSYIIIQGCDMKPASTTKFVSENMSKLGWANEEIIGFGDEGFNFGRYPQDQAPTKGWDFLFYNKQ